jgi:ParB/RepB/Spo0J family partition protein
LSPAAKLEQQIAENPDQFTIIYIHADNIHPNPLNPKHRNEDVSGLEDLLPSVREHGVLSPVLVCERAEVERNEPDLAGEMKGPAQYVMLAGARRRLTGIVAGRPLLPAVIRNDWATRRKMLEIFLIENLQRKAISPLEEAKGYKDLLDSGMTGEQIVQSVGFSKGHISKRVSLLKLPDSAKAALENDLISVTHALSLLEKLKGEPAHQEAAVRAATHPDEASRISLPQAIERERALLAHKQQEQVLREQLRAAGVPEIDEVERWGDDAWMHVILPEDVDAARAAGRIAGVTIANGVPTYYTADVAPRYSQPSSPTVSDGNLDGAGFGEDETVAASATTEHSAATPPAAAPAFSAEQLAAERAKAERQKAHSDAAVARADACRRIIEDFSKLKSDRRNDLIELLTDGVLTGIPAKGALLLGQVQQWTGLEISSEYALNETIAGSRPEAQVLALATVLAVLERQASDPEFAGDKPWPAAVVSYVRRIRDLGYHTPSDYENAKIK